MQYLSATDILAMHQRVIEETGGLDDVRGEYLLLSLAERPRASFGRAEQFPDLFTKAAAYLDVIATYHVFLDGNKRTAITAAGVFLRLNDHELNLDVDETEKFIIEAAQSKHTLPEIAAWLKERSVRV